MRTIIREEFLGSDNIAVIDDKGNRVTYRQLAQKAECLAQYVEERSLVFLLCDCQMETVEFLYQILYLNRVPLLLPKDMDRELLERLIGLYQPQYLYCGKEYGLGGIYGHRLELEEHLLLETGYDRYPLHPDLALLLSTSGTTGSAKLVKLSYDNLYDNAEYACRHLGICQGQKGLSPLAFNYTYGVSFCLWHWHCGAALLVTEHLVISREFQAFYERERVNNFAATPYSYQMMQKIRFWDAKKAEYLHFAISGGAYLPEKDQMELASAMEGKFWSGYGQTECTCIVSSMNCGDGKSKLGSVGKAFQNMETILDSETNELIIKSKSVCMGYAQNMGELAVGDVNHGVLHTGDVAYIDEDGYIYLKGRLSRYVKILGKRVSLAEVERYLEDKLPGMESACTGKDDHITVFYSGLSEGQEPAQKILSLLDSHMKLPRGLVTCLYVEEIPRNSAGKIAYGKLEGITDAGKNIGNL